MLILNFEWIVALIALAVLFAVVMQTLQAGISPMPSSAKARKAIMDMLDGTAGARIVELGSGWGNLLIPISRRYPDKQVLAYELSFAPYIVSVFLKFVLGLKNVHIYRRNFLGADLSEADVLLCYLYPGGMRRLRSKIQDDGLSPIVISHTFAFDDIEPQQIMRINDLYNSPVYLYNMDN